MADPQITCAHCGVDVHHAPSRRRDGRQAERVFCGRPCYDAKRSIEKAEARGTCATCGKPNQMGGAKFCSWQCKRAGSWPSPVNCKRCGTLFSPVKPIKRNGAVKMIGHSAGKTCCRDCHLGWNRENPERKAKISAAMSGGKHPLWQGGKSQLSYGGKRGLGWSKIRLKVIKRDGGRCVDCGMSRDECRSNFGRDLDVDHVEPFHNFATHAEANRLSNLKSRCASCHRRAEAKRVNVQMVLPFASGSGGSGYRRGERHPQAKLTATDVMAIRKRHAEGERRATIAADFGIDVGYVSSIASGRFWKSLR